MEALQEIFSSTFSHLMFFNCSDVLSQQIKKTFQGNNEVKLEKFQLSSDSMSVSISFSSLKFEGIQTKDKGRTQLIFPPNQYPEELIHILANFALDTYLEATETLRLLPSRLYSIQHKAEELIFFFTPRHSVLHHLISGWVDCCSE